MKTAFKNNVLSSDPIVPAPVATATCSLCTREQRLDVLVVQRERPFLACGDCRLLLSQARDKARPVVEELYWGFRKPTIKQELAAVEAVLVIGAEVEAAVSLFRPKARRGPKPKLGLDFTVGIFFHAGYTSGEIQWLLESVTGAERNPRYVDRLRERSALPIRESLRAFEPQKL